jgi:nucleoside-diphosphate-sugar epimerase
MHVFVTGSTGFVGRRLVDRLRSEGHQVHALVREARTPDEVAGRLEDVSAWAERLAGCDAVIHLAAIVDTWRRWEDFYKINVRATENLIAAADRAGVKRFVFVSSESVLQAGSPLLDIDETAPLPARPSSDYGRSKQLAERAVLGHAGPIERIVLRPTFIWGAGSKQLEDIVGRARAGKLPLFDGGRQSFEHVHVDTVTHVLAASLTRGVDRGIYLVTNAEPMPAAEFFGGVLNAYGLPAPKLSLPSKLIYPIAGAAEAVWRTLRLPGRPPVTRFEVEFLALPRRYRVDRARAELGPIPATTYADALATLGNTN